MIEHSTKIADASPTVDLESLNEAINNFLSSPELKDVRQSYDENLIQMLKWTNSIGSKDNYNKNDIRLAKSIVTAYLFKFYYSKIFPNINSPFNFSKALDYNNQDSAFLTEGITALENLRRVSTAHMKLASDVIFGFRTSKKYFKHLETKYKEFDLLNKGQKDRLEIMDNHYSLIKRYKFYTDRPKKLWRLKKNKATKRIRKFIRKERNNATLSSNKLAMTVIKTTSRNQVDLVSIADKKAGIMITVNSIVLSLMIPIFASYIFDLSSYIIPMFILLITSGATIVLATLATKPLSLDSMNKKELEDGTKSLFYFDNFKNMAKEEFVNSANELIVKSSYFDKSIFTDLYDVGVTLSVKYKRLRWCYSVFAIGIVLTIITFIACVVYFDF
jgi:hypothetical protein